MMGIFPGDVGVPSPSYRPLKGDLSNEYAFKVTRGMAIERVVMIEHAGMI